MLSSQQLNLDPILHISEIATPVKTFQLALFNKEGNDVTVNFSKYAIEKNTSYSIKNIEDGSTIKSGKVAENGDVLFPMGMYNQTAINFGVYRIEFNQENNKITEREGFFKRLFGWLF